MRNVITQISELPKKIFTPIRGQGAWLLRVAVLWLITGGVYYIIEGFWRTRTNGGWANITMLFIGGLCGVIIAILNENPKFRKKKMLVKALYGMAILVVIEFISGYIMNIWLGLGIWDYSSRPFNFMGQVSLLYAVLWFLLTPTIIWFDDVLRRRIWNDGEKYPWHQNYLELVKLK